jgi:hypothetical protein
MAIITNDMAFLAVQFSYDAYSENRSTSSLIAPGTRVTRLERGNLELSIYQRPDGLLAFAFRGSDEGADWLRNSRFGLVDGAPLAGKAHEGFLEGWCQVEDEVVPRAKEAVRKGNPVIVTGHSLGGAIATLAHAGLREEGLISACFTFGAPRVGNAAFVSEYEREKMHELHYRMVMENDPIVGLPPAWLGYRYTGTEIYAVPDGILEKKPDVLTRACRFMRNIGRNYRIHHISAYYALLAGTLMKEQA